MSQCGKHHIARPVTIRWFITVCSPPLVLYRKNQLLVAIAASTFSVILSYEFPRQPVWNILPPLRKRGGNDMVAKKQETLRNTTGISGKQFKRGE